MGAEKSKLIKETGYSSTSISNYEESYNTVTREKKENFTAATLHLRFRFDLNFCIAFVRAGDRERVGHLSFPNIVLTMHAIGPAEMDEKIDHAIRLYDVYGDEFLTADNLIQATKDIGGVLSGDQLTDLVSDMSDKWKCETDTPVPDDEFRSTLRNDGSASKSSEITPSKDTSASSSSTSKKESKKEKKKEESLMIRSLRARLRIAIPLNRRLLALGGDVSLRDIQLMLINELLEKHGEERLVPLTPEDVPSKSNELSRGRSKDGSTSSTSHSSSNSSTSSKLAPPGESPKKRSRSKSPMKLLHRARSDKSASSSALTTNTTTEKNENGQKGTSTVPLVLRRGVSAEKFREMAYEFPELLFSILHMRKFAQASLLRLRGNRHDRRRDIYDPYAAANVYGRQPVVIDLSNLAKTEKEIIRRKQSEEERERNKQKRIEKELDAMRKQGSSKKSKSSSVNIHAYQR